MAFYVHFLSSPLPPFFRSQNPFTVLSKSQTNLPSGVLAKLIPFYPKECIQTHWKQDSNYFFFITGFFQAVKNKINYFLSEALGRGHHQVQRKHQYPSEAWVTSKKEGEGFCWNFVASTTIIRPQDLPITLGLITVQSCGLNAECWSLKTQLTAGVLTAA